MTMMMTWVIPYRHQRHHLLGLLLGFRVSSFESCRLEFKLQIETEVRNLNYRLNKRRIEITH